jgi:hypothetical protein
VVRAIRDAPARWLTTAARLRDRLP